MNGLLVDEPSGPPFATVILAHGAGGAMDSTAMRRAAAALVATGVATVRFEFTYMRGRRDGVRRPPPRIPVLVPEYAEVLAAVLGARRGPVVLAGKSMGARVACLLAATPHDPRVVGVLAWGFPFHPPGRPEKSRMTDLAAARLPVLVCQGTRDPFGTREEFGAAALPSRVEIFWLEDGDHDLVPRVSSGHDADGHAAAAAAAAAAFARRHAGAS